MIKFSNTENINTLIELEKISLMSTLDIQKNLNSQIVKFIKNFTNNMKLSTDVCSSDEIVSYLDEGVENLNKSNSSINLLKSLIEFLELINISNDTTIESELKKYNDTYRKSMVAIYSHNTDIEQFLYKITLDGHSNSTTIDNTNNIFFENTNLSTISNVTPLQNTAPSMQSTSAINNNNNNNNNNIDYNNPIIPKSIYNNSSTENLNFCNSTYDSNTYNAYKENTLIISDTQKKVILPFSIQTLEDILANNTQKYTSIQDVIDKLYTKPINYYRFSSISRFKEAYKLVTEKEKGSKIKALSLAFELLVNYNLHPAIITACNSLDELDIYLACLEENTLEDFHFFKIIYEVPLAISKHQKIYD